jgi:3-hydroxybutyryl-CoA dehydratase
MKVGDCVDITRTFSQQDLFDYSVLSGHEVPGEQVPEPLIGALFSYLLGVKLPGLGTNYLKQETRYEAAAKTGEALIARVEVTRLRPDKQLVDLATTCHRGDGEIVASGRALVYVGDLMRKTGFEN